MKKDKIIAKLTIHGLPDMTEKRKKEIIDWLKNQIWAVKKNKDYSKRYTARFII